MAGTWVSAISLDYLALAQGLDPKHPQAYEAHQTDGTIFHVITGTGNWLQVPELTNRIPDIGSTLALFAISLTALGLGQRRVRPATR